MMMNITTSTHKAQMKTSLHMPPKSPFSAQKAK